MSTLRRSVRVVVFGWIALAISAAQAEQLPQAAGPIEIEPGDLFVLRSSSSLKWLLSPHEGDVHRLYKIAIDEAGDIAITVHDLPTGGGDPNDPNDPPPSSLAALVRQWAAEVGDTEGRQKLAAAYTASGQLVDKGTITTVDQLLALQTLANTTVLGSSAAKWRPFFEKLGGFLDQNTPANLAGYRAVWQQIAEGLSE